MNIIGLVGVGVLASVGAGTLPVDSQEQPEMHVVIVANNASVKGELPRLRYADDDGARWYELLKLASKNVRLLSVMDSTTQKRHPAVASVAIPPTWYELQRVLDRTFADIRRAKAQGRRTSFYFVYVGHGSLSSDGAGSMHLLGSYLTRRVFFERVLSRSPATTNHVIIDACHAYLMVASRGAQKNEARIDLAIDDFIAREYLASYPNTGVLLATSSSKEVHEWSKFNAGIFSHEVRSALIGAGDVNRDRVITYSEVEAFVAAANSAVDEPQARLEVFARPPAINVNEPVVSRRWLSQASVLVVPERFSGRWWLEDERGVRFADFHSDSSERLTLSLVPTGTYYLKNDREEVPIEAQGAGLVLRADRLAQVDMGALPRGASSDALDRGLFATPYGRSFYQGYMASTSDSPAYAEPMSVTEPKLEKSGMGPRQWTSVGLITAAVGAGVLGAYFAVDAHNRAEEYRSGIGGDQEGSDRLANIRRDGKKAEAMSGIMLGVSAGLALGGVLTLTW